MIARFPLPSTPREGILTLLPAARPEGVSSKGAQHYGRFFRSVNTFRGRFCGRWAWAVAAPGPGRCGARILHVRAALA